MNTSRVCTATYGQYCTLRASEMSWSTVMSEECHEATVGGVCEHVRVICEFPASMRPILLNSKLLTSVYLRTITRTMELMMKGSVTETRQMIEGQLIESGREPMNVLVVMKEDKSGSELVFLMDMSGLFGPKINPTPTQGGE